MQSLARRLGLGRVPARFATVGALCLSTVGIYLGRVQQLNSWDAIVRPGRLVAGILATVADPTPHTTDLVKAGILGAALVLGYLSVQWLSTAAGTRSRPH